MSSQATHDMPDGTAPRCQDGDASRLKIGCGLMHAFIIEDDYLIGQSIRDMLGDLGFTRFSFATSESAAIAGAAGGEKFDLITADARLLPGNGVKAVDVICEHRKIPVVFVTGYPQELSGSSKVKLSDAPVVSKPIRQEELATAVRKALA